MNRLICIQKGRLLKQIVLILVLCQCVPASVKATTIGFCNTGRGLQRIMTRGRDVPQDQLLNGKWQMGSERKYNLQADVPGIATDPSRMNAGKLWYKKEVVLSPGSWKHAVLELKGARFLPEVYIDGELAFRQNGGMAPTFHLLSHNAVKPGNKVVIEIALASLKDVPVTDASFIPPADQWRSNISSGLWDDVVLHFYNDYRIENVIPFIDFEKGMALIKFTVVPSAMTGKFHGNCAVEILGPGNKVLITKHQPVSGPADSISFEYGRILKSWSPDHPDLYRLRLTLSDVRGNIEQRTEMPFGVRKIDIRDKQFYLNDKPCKVSGGTVVWHRWVRSAEGSALGYDTAWFYHNIIQRLKEHGANYLRFHLGKPPEKLLDLCDRYGLLVQYEWSFFHGMPASLNSLLEQYREWLNMAVRHPCVSFIHPYNETEGSQLDTVWKALNILLADYPPMVLEERDVIHVHKYWWSLFENLGLYYDNYQQFPKAVMVDEFGGNYLDATGNPGAYPTVKESFLRFLGRDHTMSMRLSQQEQSCGKIAEYWRRVGVGGLAPFCILSSNEDGNNWFMGSLKEGKPKPVWDALTAAWSPQSVSIELWDRNFLPEQLLPLPVYIFNDIDQQAALKVRVSVTGLSGKIFKEQLLEVNMQPFSRQISTTSLRLPKATGDYIIKAELVNRPANVKYSVISSWKIHVFSKTIPENLAGIKIGIPENEPELKRFLEQAHIHTTSVTDKDAAVILTSVASWKNIEKGDQAITAALMQAIMDGRSVVMLDIGDRRLGQGYPRNPDDLGPLQGVAKVTDPQIFSYNLFGGVTVTFKEAAEPESHIHPDKNNKELWNNIPLENTWLWNGMRAGLIVPASDMEFAGLNPASYVAQWTSRGADEATIKGGHYYAYELQGFYAYSSKADDEDAKKKLKQKVAFLVQDAPALAASVNPETPIKITDLSQGYTNAQKGMADDLVPLVNAGKNLTRIPVVMLGFGKGKGKLIASQLLTAGRLAMDSDAGGLYGIRHDEVAAQFVLNMISLSLKHTSSL